MQAASPAPVYLVSSGAFLPGPAIANDQLDRYIAPLNRSSGRIKNKILEENGILTRHYAIDENGVSQFSTASLAAHAIRECMKQSGIAPDLVTLLCTGSSGGDVVLPGLANMVQGELGMHPLETSSHQGVCASGVSALQYAHRALQLGHHQHAVVAAAEFPSRMFKHSRFVDSRYNADFDSHFLRWMLSDGAGACLLSNRPRENGLSLQLKWVHIKSFSGDFPLCMQVGFPEKNAPSSYLDYASLAEAERSGAFFLRQNIRLLPQLFEVGIHEYVRLVREGRIDPSRIEHLLCHYSSEKFAPVIADLLDRSGMAIPRSRWYSNLVSRGNTGAASIFIMLADFLRQRDIAAGQQILCFVPESGRFTFGFFLFEVVDGKPARPEPARLHFDPPAPYVAPPAEAPRENGTTMSHVLRELAVVWHDYRSRAWRTPLIQRISTRKLTREEYLRWMECWIPQVREGSLWMRRAVANMSAEFQALRELIEEHAGDEQLDFRVLFEDYQAAGGQARTLKALKRNSGGEALNAYMYARAADSDAVDLLGAIYIIEGTGQRIIPALLPLVKAQLELPPRVYRFLDYHGQNDTRHLARWLQALNIVLDRDNGEALGEKIIATARNTAQLYVMQMEAVL